jgi:hypothetical protein
MIKISIKIGIPLSLACLILGAISCDPTYQYDFYVENTTAKDVKAVILIKGQKDVFTFDTIAVPSNDTKLIYTDENWGQVRNIAQPSDSVPAYTNIGSFQITVETSALTDSVCYQQIPVDFSKWQHSGVLTGPGKSEYTFIVDSTIAP